MSGPFETAVISPVDIFDPTLRAETAVRIKAESIGYTGAPSEDINRIGDDLYYQLYSQGWIFYYERMHDGERHVHCYNVVTPLVGKYLELGGAQGWLGYPTSSSSRTADNQADFSKFEGGRIYSSPAGVYSIHGDIRRRWTDLGEGASVLGYPTTDETETPDSVGRYNHFQFGSIYWTPDTGACEIRGAIRDRWAALGWERSYLGYPVSGELPTNQGGFVNGFQRGEIRWTGAAGAVDFPATVRLDSILTTDTSVGGRSTWMMNSRGDWWWTGHLHNSGFVGFDIAVAVRLNFIDGGGIAYAAAANGDVDGTSSTGDDRDFDWEQKGNASVIRDNWDLGVAANGITTKVQVDASIGDIISAIFSGLIIVGSALFLALGGENKVQPCPGHRQWDGTESPGSITIYKEGDPPPRCPDQF